MPAALRIMLVGSGRTLYFLARSLLDLGHRITLVDDNAAESAWLARHLKATVVHADGSVPDELRQAGAGDADVLLAASPRDEDNLVVCQAASVLFGVRRVLALVRDPELEPVFRALGVEGAFSLNRVLTELLARRVVDRSVRDLIPLGEGQASLTEIELAPEAPAVGHTLAQLALPGDSLVACIFRGESVLIPRGDTELRAGDRLEVLAMPQNHAAVLHRLTGA